jgi:hypothetical protein
MDTMQNKGILWKLLQESGYFNNISNEYFNQIQNHFESTINVISNTYPNISLVDKNKKVISDMVLYLKKYHKSSVNILSPQPQQILTKEKNINENLEKKKVEFLDLITPPEPKEIDFKDNHDEAVDGEINNLLEIAIKERENDLSFFPLEKKENEIVKDENTTNLSEPKNLSISILNEKLDIIIANQNEIIKLIKK